jgi:hypothetical protein
MLPQCLKFAFALSFCFQLTPQNYHADNRARYVENLNAAVAGDAGATYAELLRELFPGSPDAGEFAALARPLRLRNLERPREAAERKGRLKVSSVQALWFVHEGEHLLALLVNALHKPDDPDAVSEEFNVLAAFAPQSRPRLIDAAEIDFDRFVGFWEDAPLLPARQGETAFWVRAAHHNSSEGFHSYYLAELRAGRLRLALSQPFSFTDVKLCGSETSERLRVVRERGQHAGRRVFDLAVRRETKPTPDCEGDRPIARRVATRTYRLRWDARRNLYVPARLRPDSPGGGD